ncbi:hypothetical protein DMY87_16850 [Rhizobium wuzhouense]|uniref:Uncharacterized protein n=1 Tax=Rhizobium wuzhouense TaxID=1986026 RepID=A0ABX5NNL3_9HYPH|nr:hypothetical protein DMY87_16850 [Rhizobium wuzhouense]
METLHRTVTVIVSTIGLILGGWFGYDLAGPIGVLMFVPLGALAGLILSTLSWRIIYLLG